MQIGAALPQQPEFVGGGRRQKLDLVEVRPELSASGDSGVGAVMRYRLPAGACCGWLCHGRSHRSLNDCAIMHETLGHGKPAAVSSIATPKL